MPNPSKQFNEYLSNFSHPGSFIFNPVSALETENEIMNREQGFQVESKISKTYTLTSIGPYQ